MTRILVVEDDVSLNRIVCVHLNDSGYEATGCHNVASAYDAMYHTVFDLIISDIMMPEIDGFEFARTVRSINHDIPIIFMSAKDDFASKQKGYSEGIDDYMVKPVDLKELVLRVEALLRRAHIATEKKVSVGNLIMDANDMSVYVEGQELALTTREFRILFKLLSNPKRIFSRAQLMEEFWDVETEATLRAVDVYIAKLRDKLSACTGFSIITVRGIGYKAVYQ